VKQPDIIKVFKTFDTDLDGSISTEEFRKAAIKLGFHPTGDELKLLVKVIICSTPKGVHKCVLSQSVDI
jgi:Ca2+-binding EF-hand superfamily protein